MTNTMNQVKAVELNTAIVDELKAVLGIMTRYNETEDKTEAIEAGYGDVFNFGVGALVEYDLDVILYIEDVDVFVWLGSTLDGFKQYWIDTFATEAEKEYDYYQVSVGDSDAEYLYESTKDKWLGEYGKRRLFFLQSLIIFLSERTHKWYMDGDGDFIPFYTAEELANL